MEVSTSIEARAGSGGGAPARAEFLDWLRVIAIGFLLLFHTGMLFVGWGWHIENAETAASLVMPMDIAHRLRMPLLFVIAGASVHFALRRRSVVQVLRERGRRLLLPLVAGMFLVVPPQVYIERLFRGQWSGGYGEFLVTRVLRFEPYPDGDFSWHHLWFIAYLFVYCLLLVPVFAWWRRRESRIRPGPWLYLLGLPLGVNEAILKPLFPESHALLGDWYIFDHYLLLFAYGFLLCWLPGAWDWMLAWRRRSLALASVLTAAILALEAIGVLADDTVGDAITATTFTWLWLTVFLGYGKRWLSFGNGVLRYLREASYPIYILHQTVIIAVGFFVIRLPLPWQSKYLLVLAATVVICFALYELAIRRVAVLRLLFGLAPRAGAAPALAPSTQGA